MHQRLRFTLLGEGSSDQALLPILRWLLVEHLPEVALESAWADLGRLARPPRTLGERIARTLELFPCDLLFVHRDADRESPATRRTEIVAAATVAFESAGGPAPSIRQVPVVPVRMSEAWLLFDEAALRRAAGNPNGRVAISLPSIGSLEAIPDPKRLLRDLILTASELTGRRRDKLRPSAARVAGLIDDFSPLRALSAFRALEADVGSLIDAGGWR